MALPCPCADCYQDIKGEAVVTPAGRGGATLDRVNEEIQVT